MAYLPQNELEKDDDKQPVEQQSPAGKVLGSTGAAPITGTGGGQAVSSTTGAATKPSRSGLFTNLNNYLDANQGNDGAMAGHVRNKVDARATKADAAGRTYKQTADTVIADHTVTDTNGTTQAVAGLGKAPSVATPYMRSAGGTSTPTKGGPRGPVVVTPTPQTPGIETYVQSPTGGLVKVPSPTTPAKGRSPMTTAAVEAPPTTPQIKQDDFNELYNADWGSGPNSAVDIEGWDNTGQAYADVEAYGRLAAGDMNDRGALLSDTFGTAGNQYGSGERRLDSFILGAGQQGQQAMKEIADTYGNYGTNWQAIQALVDQGIAQGKSTTQATRDAIHAAVGTAQTGFDSQFKPLETLAGTKSEAAAALYTAAAEGDPAALKQLGFSDAEIKYLKSIGADFPTIVQAGTGYGLGDLTTGEQQGNYSLLLSLLGGAGADATPAYTFDKKGGTDTGLKTGVRDAVSDVTSLRDDISGRLTTGQSARDREFESVYAGLQGVLGTDVVALEKLLGLPPGTLADAERYGIDPKQFLKKGAKLNAGDVATKSEREQWGSLMALLGGGNPNAYKDTQNEGAAYTFNKDALLHAISAARGPLAAGAAATGGAPGSTIGIGPNDTGGIGLPMPADPTSPYDPMGVTKVLPGADTLDPGGVLSPNEDHRDPVGGGGALGKATKKYFGR